MQRRPLAQPLRVDPGLWERLPGAAAFEPVQWQMSDPVFHLFEREARRQDIDLKSLIRDFVCAALTERAAAIQRITTKREREASNE
jgi:hypothetical protein